MNCPNCNVQIVPDSVFCPVCGAKIQQTAPQYQQPAPQYQQPAPVANVNMFTALNKYAEFSGRARRKEYWLFVLFTFICALIPFVGFILQLAFLIPSLAVLVRRLHDTGHSGAWALLILLPIIGPIILFIFCLLDSQPGANEYGPNPKGM